MNEYFSRLNSAERRFVIIVGVVVFIVLNYFFVWPHFSDWGNLKTRIGKAQATLMRYEQAIERTPVIEGKIRLLQGSDTIIPPEDQATTFARNLQTEVARHGVRMSSSSRVTSESSSLFLAQVQTISVEATEQQLVDFLYDLGALKGSAIRVRGLFVRPEPNRTLLSANVTLVARYQKKTVGRSAAPAAVPPAAAATAPKTLAQTNRIPVTGVKPATQKKQ
jgi:hypothetical protein